MDAVLSAVIDIDATPEAVWDVLTDFAAYGEWSTFTSAEGTAHVGSRLTMRMPGMTFRPTVTVATPGQELRWASTSAPGACSTAGPADSSSRTPDLPCWWRQSVQRYRVKRWSARPSPCGCWKT
ncbi:SRPBCC family protein [Streptomyces kaempferi]